MTVKEGRLCGSTSQEVQKAGGRDFPPVEVSILDFYKIKKSKLPINWVDTINHRNRESCD